MSAAVHPVRLDSGTPAADFGSKLIEEIGERCRAAGMWVVTVVFDPRTETMALAWAMPTAKLGGIPELLEDAAAQEREAQANERGAA